MISPRARVLVAIVAAMSAACAGGAPADGPPVEAGEPASSPPATELAGRPLTWKESMRVFIDAKTDAWLEDVVESGHGIERAPAEARSIADVMSRTDWAGFPAFERDPAGVRRIHDDVIRLASELAAAADGPDAALVRSRADDLLTRCFDCHIAYRKT